MIFSGSLWLPAADRFIIKSLVIAKACNLNIIKFRGWRYSNPSGQYICNIPSWLTVIKYIRFIKVCLL